MFDSSSGGRADGDPTVAGPAAAAAAPDGPETDQTSLDEPSLDESSVAGLDLGLGGVGGLSMGGLDKIVVARMVADTHRVRMDAECQILELAAAWADLHSTPPAPGGKGGGKRGGEKLRSPGGDGTPAVTEFAAAEFGAHLDTTTNAGWDLIGDALDLRHRLPRLWTAVRAGRARVWKARQVAQATHHLTLDAARQVDAALDGLINALSWTRYQTLLAAKITEADPAGEEARTAAYEAERFVRAGRATEQGLKTLIARAAAGDVIWFLAMVTRIADILAADGDTDPVDIRRSKAIGILARPDYALHLLRTHHQPDRPEPDHPEPDHPEPDHPEPDHPEPDHPEPDHPEPDHPEPDHLDADRPQPENPGAGDPAAGPDPATDRHERADGGDPAPNPAAPNPAAPNPAAPDPAATARTQPDQDHQPDQHREADRDRGADRDRERMAGHQPGAPASASGRSGRRSGWEPQKDWEPQQDWEPERNGACEPDWSPEYEPEPDWQPPAEPEPPPEAEPERERNWDCPPDWEREPDSRPGTGNDPEPDPEADGHTSVGLGSDSPIDLAASRPRLDLMVHLSAEALTLHGGPVRIEGVGPMVLGQLRRWLADTNPTIMLRPVIDLNADAAPVDAYEAPTRLRRFIGLRIPASGFPHSPTAGTRSDLDHTIAWTPPDKGGPPGQTRVGNLAPLNRTEHRLKTHSNWQVRQPETGIFVWRSPTGHHWLTTPWAGTYPLGDQTTAQTIWHALSTNDNNKPGTTAARPSE